MDSTYLESFSKEIERDVEVQFIMLNQHSLLHCTLL